MLNEFVCYGGQNLLDGRLLYLHKMSFMLVCFGT